MGLESNIKRLKDLCAKYETLEFLTFLAGVLLQIPQRHDNPFLKKLMSPMRQLFFLGFLNSLSAPSKNQKGFSEEDWEEMVDLLCQIEMDYFFLLGFPKNGKETKKDVEQISVTMPTFMNYFFNGPLSYQEQEIERIENIFSVFEDDLIGRYDITLADIINFYDLTNDEINKNLNLVFKFTNPENWQKFTASCIEKGLHDPKDWINEAPDEIYAFVNFMQNPGSFLKLDLNKIDYDSISKSKYEKILKLFTFKISPKEDIVYYTENNALMESPLIRLNENHFLPFYIKQYLNAAYNFLFDFSSRINKEKLLKQRDSFVEEKVETLFKDFFGKQASIYSNYSIDNNKSEQDILILYKNTAIIIEVKAGSYRAPMRDPEKAYKKLESDFKKIIQNAYNQTLRVKDAFYENESLIVRNEKKQKLDEFSTVKFRGNLYSIIVSLERFGHIQSNLENMLKIDKNDDFPWAVSLDDLETFLLTLNKSKKRNKIQAFLQYVKIRENYHGHLLCSDELELCGLYLKRPKDFVVWSNTDKVIVTTDDLTEPIEKAYSDGIGFKNERNSIAKKDKTTGILYGDNHNKH